MEVSKSLYKTEQRHSWALLLINWSRTYDDHTRWSQRNTASIRNQAGKNCVSKNCEICQLSTTKSETLLQVTSNVRLDGTKFIPWKLKYHCASIILYPMSQFPPLIISFLSSIQIFHCFKSIQIYPSKYYYNFQLVM